MSCCTLGIDTSNYTTSAAIYDSGRQTLLSKKRLLSVEEGKRGLRQSDAVFAHTKQLPEIMRELFEESHTPIGAVCASAYPRRLEGSYMPAFLVGKGTGFSISQAMGVPFYECSHQEGHIAAAAYGAGRLSLLKEEFYAFHVSGGTTECLLVRPEQSLFSVEKIAGTLDLNAGQLIDRIGVMLSLPFPSGERMDLLSRQCEEKFSIRPAFHGLDCHFSGAQNQAELLFEKSAKPEAVARFTLEYVLACIDHMTELVLQSYGKKPLLYAGGVMSNTLIREKLTKKYGAYFADPSFSSDNAAGAALIAAIQEEGI